mmetsp:Transcript_4288/g.15020  ORF Transcript_4288/g.15020 Transcript_4288/m.15020 type:complete len:200 (+) Transcript_4288:1071-1670(+)
MKNLPRCSFFFTAGSGSFGAGAAALEMPAEGSPPVVLPRWRFIASAASFGGDSIIASSSSSRLILNRPLWAAGVFCLMLSGLVTCMGAPEPGPAPGACMLSGGFPTGLESSAEAPWPTAAVVSFAASILSSFTSKSHALTPLTYAFWDLVSISCCAANFETSAPAPAAVFCTSSLCAVFERLWTRSTSEGRPFSKCLTR